jgi:lipopolysaccharide biosynthesis glycosyltransferase
MTHIVLAADADYLEYVPCLLMQIATHGRQCTGVVLLTPPGLDPLRLADLERSADGWSVQLQIVEVPQIADIAPPDAIQAHNHVSAFTFTKLLIPTLLPALDQVLYLDVDILVRDSLDPLLSWDLSHPIGAVDEIGDGALHLFGTTRVPYFNAGVLRMSLVALRRIDLLGSSKAILRKRPQLPFHDQDVLNLIFRDDHDSLPFAFNVFETIASAGLPSWKILNDPAIVHFVGPDKPWRDGYRSDFTREWRAVHAKATGLPAEQAVRYVGSRRTDHPRLLTRVARRARRVVANASGSRSRSG